MNLWRAGGIQNISGGLIVSGTYNGDNPSSPGQGVGSVFTISGQQLQLINATLFPNGSLLSDTGAFTNVVIDSGSQIGPYITKNVGTICTNSPQICTLSYGIMTAGSPGISSCSVTGAGTGATCSPATGSSISNFGVFITTGTSPSSSGTVTANFGTSFTGSAPTCIAGLDDTNTAWSATALPPHQTAVSNSSVTFSWNNNGTKLTASGNYRIGVHCIGK
jgi:hypothetical protein